VDTPKVFKLMLKGTRHAYIFFVKLTFTVSNVIGYCSEASNYTQSHSDAKFAL